MTNRTMCCFRKKKHKHGVKKVQYQAMEKDSEQRTKRGSVGPQRLTQKALLEIKRSVYMITE